MVQFTNSPYRFTDPIRYFKANDPIYYEVDNIPLKQLQENDLWLKDQIEKIVIPQSTGTTSTNNNTTIVNGSITRSQFLELQPFVNGSDSIVRVMAGRYTARINDAYKINQLQSILQTGGLESGQFNTYEFKTNIDSFLTSALDKFKTMVPSKALGMNGLYERAFTYAMETNDIPSQFLQKLVPAYTQNQAGRQAPYPNVTGRNITYDTNVSSVVLQPWTAQLGFRNLPAIESEFIKRWRGVTRTAIVDVPSILTINIPPFEASDFTYEDESGQQVIMTDAIQRIDLVFIYSKPVDVSSVTINKFSQDNLNTPTKISQPVLGLVRGAGIGIRSARASTDGMNEEDLLDDSNNPQILPNVADQIGTNLGFSGYSKGSFPSPDDLMNLAPLLSERLESDHIALIGQTILPVAYVIVRKIPSVNSLNNPILTNSDIIDIRPFFRTTELSYNERAGIAAATPQLSLANPVATESYVDLVAKDIIAQIPTLPTTGEGILFPTVVKSGYILGGVKYGPEGTLISNLRSINPNSSEDFGTRLRSFYAYPPGRNIPEYPDWDVAWWCKSPFPNPGTKRNDWINFTCSPSRGNTGDPGKTLKFYPESWPPTHAKFSSHWFIHSHFYVTKTLEIELPVWARDFNVNVQLLNCCHTLGVRPPDPNGNESGAKSVGTFVSKRKLSNSLYEFTIFVAWGAHIESQPDNAGDYGTTFPTYYRDIEPASYHHRGNFNGFFVSTKEIFQTEPRFVQMHGYGRANDPNLGSGGNLALGSPMNGGICLYPSVHFEVVLLPENSGYNVDYGNSNNKRIAIS